MNDYYEVRVNLTPCTEDETALLAALLGDAGFESFVPDETGLSAYIKAEDYVKENVEAAIDELPFECQKEWTATLIPGQDWNEEWEKNYFQPIVVGNENGNGVVIHSSFHNDVAKAKYDIVIDPKMAFGTGHHATTSQIIRQLLALDLDGKSVMDMGTGTGILAILSAMRGAKVAVGVEIDAFAYDNAKENVALNGQQQNVTLIHGDANAMIQQLEVDAFDPVDVFIANINRNIIVNDLPLYAQALKHGGAMILSGFYEQDMPIVCEAAEANGLKFEYATAAPAVERGDATPKSINELPERGIGTGEMADLGRYGAVEGASPESYWACVVLKKN